MSKKVVLQNVDHYRVCEPLFEGVRVILSYRGEKHSPAYIQGLSGAAFRIGGPCPCAPTCEAAMWPAALVQLLGYEVHHFSLSEPGRDPKAGLPEVPARLREEIRAGRPVLAWNAFTTAEFDVVCGFDEEKGELIGRGSYLGMNGYARAPEARLADTEIAPALGIVLIGKKLMDYDARAAELAALKEAVAHAHGASTSLPGLPSGLRCYDAWIAGYRSRGALIRAQDRSGKDLDFVAVAQTPDDFYPLTILPSTRRAASQFCVELALKYPAGKAHLEMAAEHFARESEALEVTRKLLENRKQGITDEQCVRAAGYLSQARAMYGLGIEELAAALRKTGGPQSNAGI